MCLEIQFLNMLSYPVVSTEIKYLATALGGKKLLLISVEVNVLVHTLSFHLDTWFIQRTSLQGFPSVSLEWTTLDIVN